MYICMYVSGCVVRLSSLCSRETRTHTRDVISMWRALVNFNFKVMSKATIKTVQQPSLQTSGQHLDQLVQDKSTSRKRRRAAESPDQRELDWIDKGNTRENTGNERQ